MEIENKYFGLNDQLLSGNVNIYEVNVNNICSIKDIIKDPSNFSILAKRTSNEAATGIMNDAIKYFYSRSSADLTGINNILEIQKSHFLTPRSGIASGLLKNSSKYPNMDKASQAGLHHDDAINVYPKGMYAYVKNPKGDDNIDIIAGSWPSRSRNTNRYDFKDRANIFSGKSYAYNYNYRYPYAYHSKKLSFAKQFNLNPVQVLGTIMICGSFDSGGLMASKGKKHILSVPDIKDVSLLGTGFWNDHNDGFDYVEVMTIIATPIGSNSYQIEDLKDLKRANEIDLYIGPLRTNSIYPISDVLEVVDKQNKKTEKREFSANKRLAKHLDVLMN
jgi:hypothetical protein